ncbi:phosphotransferase [Candidatus Colwellia aromaticivorans]|uniref:phosphotransferase n=1 Tax=Candidatus Colwellia aromaticivorans TaxID=2267621 RepID=UPI000DF49443|nr:phosphotransferase [Candidatus Colwellia aromaticivorans]
MKDALSALSCFTQVENISIIAPGLSQHCFKVNADNKVYFAKTISDNTEVSMALSAGESGLSPNVVYHDQHWLISNFINANNLALSTIVSDEKINHAIKLMVQCHQLKVEPAELVVKDIINSLVNNLAYSALQQTELCQLADLISPPLNISRNIVCCHGDLNFSNVLINLKQRTWLVDYECACTAPIEYDLAMFIAVNGLASDEVSIIIEQYEYQSSVYVDPRLLNHYLLFCYFINTLWYFNAYQEKIRSEESNSQSTSTEHNKALLKHAQKQWYALHSSLKIDDSPLLSGLSIKLTNILPALDLNNQT